LHEEIRNPKSIEEITSTFFFRTRRKLHSEEIVNIRMPGFQVHGKGTIALAPSLVYIASGVVEYTEHRSESIGLAVRALDERATGSDIVNMKTNASRILGNGCTIPQCLVDSRNAIFRHGKQETRRELLSGRAGIKESRRCVGEILLGEEIIGFKGTLKRFLFSPQS
jgi:hypothetical protein